MLVPYCYQCAPGPQSAILTIANAYTVRMPGGMQNEECSPPSAVTLRRTGMQNGEVYWVSFGAAVV